MIRRTFVAFMIAGLLLVSCTVPVTTLVENQPFSYGGIVPIRTIDGAGSGFVIRDEGTSYLIVTAAHVVDEEATVLILGIEADVIAVDYDTDVAIVRIPKFEREWKVWPLSDAEIEDKCRVAGFVYVNGIDSPLLAIYWGRVTTVNWQGFVSFNGGAFPGISGGPLINEKGEVTAICSGCMGAWGLPMETATVLSPIKNVRALLEIIDNEVVQETNDG